MLSKGLIEFSKTISFTVKDDSAFGHLNDFLVSIYESISQKNFYVYYILDSKKTYKNDSPVSIMTISGNLSDVFEKYNVTNYSVKENGIRVSCNLSYVSFYNLINDVINKLSGISALKKNICSECGNEILPLTPKYRISTDGINMLLCSDCANYLLGNDNEENEGDADSNETENSLDSDGSCAEENEGDADSNETENSLDSDGSCAEENIMFTTKSGSDNLPSNNYNRKKNDITKSENKKTYRIDKTEKTKEDCSISPSEAQKGSALKGVIGAVLFGLGVSICIISLYIFAVPATTESSFKPGYYVNWISSFTAVAAYFGYRIFSKKESKINNILIPGIVSVILAFLTQYISSVSLFARERFFVYEEATWSRFTKALPNMLKAVFTDSNASSDFKIYIMMDIIFVIVALLLISFFLAKNTTESNEKIIIEKI